jgi:hypothetical protein
MNDTKLELLVEALVDRYTPLELMAELEDLGFFDNLHDTLIDFFKNHAIAAYTLAAEIEYDLE